MSIPSSSLQDARCPICSDNKLDKIFNLESPYISHLQYQIHQCFNCKHRFAVGPVSEQILGEVYGAAFHASSQQLANSPSSSVVINATRRARWLVKYGLQGKLLDVGAGRGYFVEAASGYFDARGIDYSTDAVQFGKTIGVEVDSGNFMQAQYPFGSFDVLTFWDVLASMVDVRSTMLHAAKLLRQGGFAVLTIPMGDSLSCRVSGKRWPLWIPPVNLHYFSKESLATLMRESGFEIMHMEYQAKQVALNFLLLKLVRSLGFRNLEQSMAKLPLRWSISINLRDIQTVVVRKL